jgi:hypothetical protein
MHPPVASLAMRPSGPRRAYRSTSRRQQPRSRSRRPSRRRSFDTARCTPRARLRDYCPLQRSAATTTLTASRPRSWLKAVPAGGLHHQCRVRTPHGWCFWRLREGRLRRPQNVRSKIRHPLSRTPWPLPSKENNCATEARNHETVFARLLPICRARHGCSRGLNERGDDPPLAPSVDYRGGLG